MGSAQDVHWHDHNVAARVHSNADLLHRPRLAAAALRWPLQVAHSHSHPSLTLHPLNVFIFFRLNLIGPFLSKLSLRLSRVQIHFSHCCFEHNT